MTRVRPRGESIRRYIIENINKNPKDISRITSEKFGISRQAVNKHLQRLTAEHTLQESGKTRNRAYKIVPLVEAKQHFELKAGLQEDVVWRESIRPAIEPLPENVSGIWHYGFTEMFNNAIDHSGGKTISVHIKKTATYTEILILDDGVGIFRKIRQALNLLDERHAILELSKGKLTTDPRNHTGQGIFFTSRMFDSFDILSGGVYFSHEFDKEENWILEREKSMDGTAVWMKLNNHASRTSRKIFGQYSSGDDYGFTRTVVPVKLAQYDNDQLISRSQAKRVLARVELFKIVIFNFEGVHAIGQAFADEIFRVFANNHPEIQLLTEKTGSEVKRMIERAKTGAMPKDPPATSPPS